ncbi:hypothetical protein ACRZ5S_17610 [Vibrio scophthalmi]|uniref:hypothetical protein n=1 Tax=Vibrio scophthalmi TaxID=45658 RepID=UPI003EC08BF7
MRNNDSHESLVGALWEGLLLPTFHLSEIHTPVIALEGHNGAGKSTIATLICDYFKKDIHLGVPDLFLVGGRKYRMVAEANWQGSALYFLSGVIDKIRELRMISQPEDFHLIERSLWSTLSAHASEDPERLAKLVTVIHEMGIEYCEPDYTIVLTATFEHCYQRIQLKKSVEEKALDSLVTHEAYYLKEAVFYRWLMRQRPKRVFEIDVTGRESVDVFHEDILPILSKLKGEK